MEDWLELPSDLVGDCLDFSSLGACFLKGAAPDSNLFFLKARTELKLALALTDGGNLSFIRDSVLICLLLIRKLLSLRDKGLTPKGLTPKGLGANGLLPKGLVPKGLLPKGLPAKGLGMFRGGGLSLLGYLGSSCSMAWSEGWWWTSDILLFRGSGIRLSREGDCGGPPFHDGGLYGGGCGWASCTRSLL